MKQSIQQRGLNTGTFTGRLRTFWVCFGVSLMALSQALGQTLPLQIDQKATLYNYQSYSGVPLSDDVNDP
nr:hypothetical protein [Pseudomonadales bacterium]